MVRDQKIMDLRVLERNGIVRELCPVADSSGLNTAYWRFYVIKPELLPESMKEEYKRLREIRW